MDGLLIFDYSNDLIFIQLNQKLRAKVNKLAKTQGLIENGEAKVKITFFSSSEF